MRLCTRRRQAFSLTGRNRSSVEAVADEIVSEGGSAETAEIDALSEQAVDGHLQSAIEKAGRVDISFNAVGIRNTTLQGVPWLSWMSSSSPCRSQPTQGRIS